MEIELFNGGIHKCADDCLARAIIGIGPQNKLPRSKGSQYATVGPDAVREFEKTAAGEKLAAAYISSAFAKLSLSPTKDGGYFQHFPIADGKQINFAAQAFVQI